MISRIKPSLLLVAGWTALGCAPGAGLHPAESAFVVAPNVAQTLAAGVVVRACGNVWPGNSEVLDHVTPLHIWVDNRADQPIQIRYSRISLETRDGQTFLALPLWKIQGTVEVNVSVVPESRSSDSAGAARAKYRYSGIDPEPPLSIRTQPYYDHLYDNWTAQVPLPTEDMKEMALPEALLKPPGEVSGFVYFEHVPEEKRDYVTLNVDLVEADADTLLGRAEIPFVR